MGLFENAYKTLNLCLFCVCLPLIWLKLSGSFWKRLPWQPYQGILQFDMVTVC